MQIVVKNSFFLMVTVKQVTVRICLSIKTKIFVVVKKQNKVIHTNVLTNMCTFLEWKADIIVT